jgi:hypothetical protein
MGDTEMRSFTLGSTVTWVVLAGCADSVDLVAYHDSHLTQHAGTHPTNHSADIVGVTSTWHVTHSARLEVTEGYSVHGRDGCLDCPREAFSARVIYEVWHK